MNGSRTIPRSIDFLPLMAGYGARKANGRSAEPWGHPANGEGSGALRRTPHGYIHQPACKPGSVGHRPLARTIRDGHSSGTTFARCLKQPTRTTSLTSLLRRYRFRELPALPPLFGLAPGGVYHAGSVAGPAVRSYRTFSPLLPSPCPSLRGRVGEAVRSLWHCPWGCPRRELSGTVCRWSPDFPLPQAFRPWRERPSGRLTSKAWGFAEPASRRAET
jgi:hypothetical protein